MTDTPDVSPPLVTDTMIVSPPQTQAGRRKLIALGLGLLALLIGTVVIVLQADVSKYSTVYITFASTVGGMVIGFMGGNAGEHLGKAVAAGRRLANLVGMTKPADPKL